MPGLLPHGAQNSCSASAQPFVELITFVTLKKVTLVTVHCPVLFLVRFMVAGKCNALRITGDNPHILRGKFPC